MDRITVELIHHTPLFVASVGARTCWQSGDKSDTCLHEKMSTNNALGIEMCESCGDISSAIKIGPKDLALLDRVGNQFRHASILEHISFNFFIDGISRGCLQELARHRLASPSVKSSRYTLKELKSEQSFIERIYPSDDKARSFKYLRGSANRYLVFTHNLAVDNASIDALENLRKVIVDGTSNDEAKYCMPEAYRTQLTWSLNLRSLQNFLQLRTAKSAHFEIRHLANLIFNILPSDVKMLVEHCVYKETQEQED